VYDPQGNNIGSIKRLMIEKISGRVAYAVMSFGGFLGLGEEEHAIPWSKLTYDTNLGGYRTESRKVSCAAHPHLPVIRLGTGAIASANKNCTIITAQLIIGASRRSAVPKSMRLSFSICRVARWRRPCGQ
jgi:PRC-barrel domain